MANNSATTPPTCPICGAAHWMRDPHVFAGKVAAPEPELLSPRPAKNERQMVDITPTKKSTAALKEVLEETRSGKARGRSVGIATQPPKGLRTDRDLAPGGRIPEAGTQAPPVDTTSRADEAALRIAAVGGAMTNEQARKVVNVDAVKADASRLRAEVAKAALAQAEKPKRRGRPSTGFDKKAHDRAKARERRAAKKEAKA